MYRDALAPIPNPRVPKPWERSAVPAHAQRLQGHKIWKTAGTRAQNKRDDAAQLERDLEGKGSRKRARAGGKENIGEGKWVKGGIPGLVLAVTGDENMREEDGARGRKRTNMDKLISPRKPLGQKVNGTLSLESQAPAFLSDEPRRRKSMRKSIRSSLISADLVIAVQEDDTRGQSDMMQGPYQFGSVSSLVDQERRTSSLVEKDVTAVSPVAIKAEALNTDKDDSLVPAYEENKEERGVSTTLQSDIERKAGVTKAATPPQETEILDPPSEDVSHGINSDDEVPQLITVSDQAEISQESVVTKQLPSSPAKKSPVKISLNDAVENTIPFKFRPVKEEFGDVGLPPKLLDENQSPIIASVELAPGFTEPTESTTTPKKRRSSSMRQGTRRSTRNIRASSANILEQISVDIQAPMAEPKSAKKNSGLLHTPRRTEKQIPEGRLSPTVSFFEDFELPAADMVSLRINSNTVPVSEDFAFLDTEDPEAPATPKPLESERVLETSGDRFEDAEFEPPLICVSPTKLISPSKAFGDLAASISPLGQDNISDDSFSFDSSPVQFSPIKTEAIFSNSNSTLEDGTVDNTEALGQILSPSPIEETTTINSPDGSIDETTVPDSTISDLVATISENAPPLAYEHDDTDLLRNFITRVKADKEAKTQKVNTKRKWSLPHSPIQLPLGEVVAPSPSPPKDPKELEELDARPTEIISPSNKRRKIKNLSEDDQTEPKSIRRSGRTRLPVVKSSIPAPNFIPVRRLGQDADTPVALNRRAERNAERMTAKKLEDTTRKNKFGAISAQEFLQKKLDNKDDPVLRQRLLKEVFDDNAQAGKGKVKAKSVTWAEEIAQYQEAPREVGRLGRPEPKKRVEKSVKRVKPVTKQKSLEKVETVSNETSLEREVPIEAEKLVKNDKPAEQSLEVAGDEKEKKTTVRTGSRSKIARAANKNGTPAPKRKTREKA